MAKNSHLKDMQAVGPLTVLRADLLEEGSFDEAVAGVDGDLDLWMSPGFMPITRDLSESRRTLLQAWCRKVLADGGAT